MKSENDVKYNIRSESVSAARNRFIFWFIVSLMSVALYAAIKSYFPLSAIPVSAIYIIAIVMLCKLMKCLHDKDIGLCVFSCLFFIPYIGYGIYFIVKANRAIQNGYVEVYEPNSEKINGKSN